jgi:hypothetical protein
MHWKQRGGYPTVGLRSGGKTANRAIHALVREALDLARIQEESLVGFDAWELDAGAGIEVDQAALNRRAKELTQKAMSLLNARGTQTRATHL